MCSSCFFFFKQKTAYEMRISDWSSDVCSSDLEVDLGVAVFIEGEEEYGSRSFAQFLSDNLEALRADAIVVADSGNWDEHTPALTVSLREIGRASCRERVCQYV